jgi:hypothetical protein
MADIGEYIVEVYWEADGHFPTWFRWLGGWVARRLWSRSSTMDKVQRIFVFF